MTLISPTGKKVHLQTVDVDKNGEPTEREWKSAMRIFIATGQTVILVPKQHQLAKRRLKDKDVGPNLKFKN